MVLLIILDITWELLSSLVVAVVVALLYSTGLADQESWVSKFSRDVESVSLILKLYLAYVHMSKLQTNTTAKAASAVKFYSIRIIFSAV